MGSGAAGGSEAGLGASLLPDRVRSRSGGDGGGGGAINPGDGGGSARPLSRPGVPSLFEQASPAAGQATRLHQPAGGQFSMAES